MAHINQPPLESVQTTPRRSACLRGNEPDFVDELPAPTRVGTRPRAQKKSVSSDVRQGVFRFMDLPRELRNEIYHALWKNTPHVGGISYAPPDVKPYKSRKHERTVMFMKRKGLVPYGRKVNGEYESEGEVVPVHNDSDKHFPFSPLRFCFLYDNDSNKGSSVQGLSQWLLTSRAILNEGIEQLYLKSMVESGKATKEFNHAAKTSSLFDPVIISAETLLFDERRYLELNNRNAAYVFQINEYQAPELHIILQIFTNLTHLTLRFAINHGRINIPYALDLLQLEGGCLKPWSSRRV